ncbi:MAG: heparinase II/III family protein [Oscillospiraceae bacterium]
MPFTLKEVHTALEDSRSGYGAFRRHFADSKRVAYVREHPYFAETIAEIREKEATYRHSHIPITTFSQYKLFELEGTRAEFNKSYFKRREMLNTYAALSLLFPEEKRYNEGLEDIIWAICDEYTWCDPAHLEGTGLDVISKEQPRVREGVIAPRKRSHRQRVDLFSAETAFALAETVSMLGEQLAPVVTDRAVSEIAERVLSPFAELNTYFWWETSDMNWGAVCAGSVGAAAMYLVEEPGMLAPTLSRCIQTMEEFLSGFLDDGVCREGIGYWSYGFGYFTYFAELLLRRSGGVIDLFSLPKTREIAAFQQHAYLSGGRVVSFSDTNPEGRYQVGLTHFLKGIYGIREPFGAEKAGFYADSCHRFPSAMRFFSWADLVGERDKGEDSCRIFEQSQWFLCKKWTGDRLFAVAAKGGHNGEPHNHNDIGSFILHSGGVNFLTDLGYGEYTRDYFEGERYNFLCNGSQGHSVPQIDGAAQKAGESHGAKIIPTSGDGVFSVDIAGAYELSGLNTLVRNFSVQEENGPALSLIDRYSFGQPPESVVEQFVTLVKPVMGVPSLVELPHHGEALQIHYDRELMMPSVEKTSYRTHDHREETVYLLKFRVTSPAKELDCHFNFRFLRR